jgi:Invasion associated locus B (IalB) protein
MPSPHLINMLMILSKLRPKLYQIWRKGPEMTKPSRALLLLPAALPFLIAAAPPATQAAPEPKLLGEYKDWAAYSMAEPKGSICYAVSKPKKAEPAKLKRGEAHLLVTHRPSEKQNNVVSVELGYPTAKDSSATVMIGKDKFDLFTDKQTAWARDSDTDKSVVTAMARAADLTAKAKSASGTEVTDSYSLAGFSDALAQIDKACKVKR